MAITELLQELEHDCNEIVSGFAKSNMMLFGLQRYFFRRRRRLLEKRWDSGEQCIRSLTTTKHSLLQMFIFPHVNLYRAGLNMLQLYYI